MLPKTVVPTARNQASRAIVNVVPARSCLARALTALMTVSVMLLSTDSFSFAATCNREQSLCCDLWAVDCQNVKEGPRVCVLEPTFDKAEKKVAWHKKAEAMLCKFFGEKVVPDDCSTSYGAPRCASEGMYLTRKLGVGAGKAVVASPKQKRALLKLAGRVLQKARRIESELASALAHEPNRYEGIGDVLKDYASSLKDAMSEVDRLEFLLKQKTPSENLDSLFLEYNSDGKLADWYQAGGSGDAALFNATAAATQTLDLLTNQAQHAASLASATQNAHFSGTQIVENEAARATESISIGSEFITIDELLIRKDGTRPPIIEHNRIKISQVEEFKIRGPDEAGEYQVRPKCSEDCWHVTEGTFMYDTNLWDLWFTSRTEAESFVQTVMSKKKTRSSR